MSEIVAGGLCAAAGREESVWSTVERGWRGWVTIVCPVVDVAGKRRYYLGSQEDIGPAGVWRLYRRREASMRASAS